VPTHQEDAPTFAPGTDTLYDEHGDGVVRRFAIDVDEVTQLAAPSSPEASPRKSAPDTAFRRQNLICDQPVSEERHEPHSQPRDGTASPAARLGAAQRLAAVSRRPTVDHELPAVGRDDRERVDVDREQVPVLGRLEATFGLQPGAKR
jgi:hypothetical protein